MHTTTQNSADVLYRQIGQITQVLAFPQTWVNNPRFLNSHKKNDWQLSSKVGQTTQLSSKVGQTTQLLSVAKFKSWVDHPRLSIPPNFESWVDHPRLSIPPKIFLPAAQFLVNHPTSSG